ncbi:PREDICTED: protein LURP-one-related 12-like [Ipomoea nil]|uniref:protein LURP-one-related 12-like n=1 Tax=Ipomoea nil TaxID=35883 RepID=UPI000900AF3B|nr:PREDICTED: protein LURP-one-related 12-like [Ipomoea nil]XP_019170049.1 PREDICTED: protein LURP-one-related 12-like [Ipomoea nil]
MNNGFVYKQEVHLTVLKTSVFFAGDGFAAYSSDGQLLLRADSYGPDKRHQGELVLTDAAGKCLLTLRRKWPSLHQRWEGFSGEGTEGQKPIFSVRWSSIIGRSSVTVEVYDDPGEEYKIEGCFAQRNCTIFNAAAGEEPVAEIRRKVDPSANVVLGREVFSLLLKPGFDGAFAMGLVLVLDQIHTDEDDHYFTNKGDDRRVRAEPISDD